MLSNSFFIVMFTTGLATFLVSIYYSLKPPKKINKIYGYRTKRSMKSQEAWDYAQVHSANEMKMWSLLTMLASFLGPVIISNNVFGAILGIVTAVLFILLSVIRTDMALREKFNNKV